MPNDNNKYIAWEQVFDAMGEAVFIADINNTIIKANRACGELFRMKVEDIIGKKCYVLMHGLNGPWPECPFEKSKRDKKKYANQAVITKRGEYLLVTVSPVLNEAGDVIAVVHISKDITDIKKMESELKKKIEELERFQKITVDRELKMKELKVRIAELEAKKEGNKQAG